MDSLICNERLSARRYVLRRRRRMKISAIDASRRRRCRGERENSRKHRCSQRSPFPLAAFPLAATSTLVKPSRNFAFRTRRGRRGRRKANEGRRSGPVNAALTESREHRYTSFESSSDARAFVVCAVYLLNNVAHPRNVVRQGI